MKNTKKIYLSGPNLEETFKSSLSDPIKNKSYKAYEENQAASKNGGKQEKDGQETLPPVPFHQLFRYSTGLQKCLMCIGTVAAAISGCCQTLNTLLYGTLLGSMVDFGSGTISGPELMDAGLTFAVYNTIIGVVMLICTYLSTMLFEHCSQRQLFLARNMFLQSALHQDIAWYDLNRSGEIASRMTEDMTKFEGGIGEKIPIFIYHFSTFIACIILAFVKGWKLALVCLASVPLTLITMSIVGRVSARLARNEMDTYAKAGSIAEEVLSSMRTVVAFGGQKEELARYTKNLVHAYKNNVRKGFFEGMGNAIRWFFLYANYALSFWYGVTLLLEDRILPAEEQTYTAAAVVTIFMSVMMGSMNIAITSPYLESFAVARGAAIKIFSVIERKSLIDSRSTEGEKPTKVGGSITFKNVAFEYPSRPDVKILRGLDLTINKGETVALVGGSGCGKSTCIQLMQRFYDPREGQILLDGNDLRDLNVKWLRSQIGVVGQEPVLFGTTISENIRYGDHNATVEDIIRAAKEANAHDFITKLPYGYETMVGERGAQISGGQKQRIAIARALVRSPKVLLLDEATSALDMRNESVVQAALDKASKGRTSIIVAHRLSTIKGADKIIVLSNGVAVEEGNHDTLMALKGHYHSLVTTQISEVDKEDGTDVKYDREKDVDDEDLAKSVMMEKEPEVDESKKEKAPLRRIARLNAPEWHYILPAVLGSIVVGSMMPLFAVLFSGVVGELSSPDEEVRNTVNLYCIFFVISGAGVGVATFLQIFGFAVAGERLIKRMRGLAFEAMLRQEMAWFDKPENGTGSLCAKLSGEAAAVQGATGQPLGSLVQSISTIILGITLAMYYEWRLGLVGVAFMPLILISYYLQSGVKRRELFSHHNDLEKATKIAVEAVSSIRTVIALGKEGTFLSAYEETMRPSFELAVRNTHFRGIVFGMARCMTFFAYAACMYYGVYLVVNEGLQYAVILRVGPALITSSIFVGNAFAFLPNFHKGLVAATKLFTLMNRQSKIQDPKDAKDEKWAPKGEVTYRSVSFEYPTRPGTKVLNDLNLDVPSGKTIALIGSSGCGKSTVIQLLERFYDPDSGTVALGGRNISTVTQASLRIQLGIVSQEPSLFARTIAENIAYGDNTRSIAMAEIEAVAKKANIHNFITSLPLGYDTELGDRGTQLSGGQKQRVAIARSLIRNPKILLLDEATSALDMESEKIVQAALDEAKEGRTCITIAHRLSTIQDADQICVLDKGVVAESGTHSELVKSRGLYYKLLAMQK